MTSGVLLVVLVSVVLGATFTAAQLSDIMKVKIGRHWYLANAIRDATLLIEDYAFIAQNTINLSPACKKNTPQQARDTVVLAAWAAFPNQNLTRDQYFAAVTAGYNTTNMAAMIRSLATVMYNLWNCIGPDFNDNAMTLDELKCEFLGLGIPVSQTAKTFQAMDTNGDLKVTVDEYVNCALNFFSSNNQNDPSNSFFGNLTPQ